MAQKMNKYIDAEKLKAEIERLLECTELHRGEPVVYGSRQTLYRIKDFIDSLQQEQPQEENKLPNKRMRVNYAICKLQAFEPLREAIVLDDYVYDEGKCYRENLINYIHAIPENRLTEIRSYLREKGWWPYDDDADWMEQEHLDDADWTEQEHLKVDLEKEVVSICKTYGITKHLDAELGPLDIRNIAHHFYELGLSSRKEE